MENYKSEEIFEKVRLRKELEYVLDNLTREKKGWSLSNRHLLSVHEFSESASDCLKEIIAEKIYCIDCELEDL